MIEETHVWFYWEGWRYGKIIKRHSENHMSVEDCTRRKHQVKLSIKNNWISCRHKEFTGQNNLRGKTNGQEKSKVKGKRRFKVKIKRRIVRKS